MSGVWAAVCGWWRAVRAPSTGRHRKLPQPAPVVFAEVPAEPVTVTARGSAEPASRLDEERTTYIPAWTDRKWWWSR